MARKAAWEDRFIECLQEFGVVARAARAAGVYKTSPYKRRETHAEFAARWEQALAKAAALHRREPDASGDIAPMPRMWHAAFLEALAETSNVTAAADAARVSAREAYAKRRTDRPFAALWQSALYEGYCNLEMEILGHLRDPDPAQKMDVANGLRLLAAHRESAAREGAKRVHVSAAEVRISIDSKVEALRKQVAARQRASRNRKQR